jgi:nucleotide-binding universal stress UspA family protein
MTYKTILTYCPTPDRVEPVLDVALPVARRHGAHLIGLHVIPQPHMYWAVAAEMSAVVLDAQKEFYEDLARTSERAFENQTRSEDIACEWRQVDSAGYPIADLIAAHAASCDLVIMGNTGPGDDWATRGDLPARTIIGCGRPVLVLPQQTASAEPGKNIAIAWDGGREAARAAFDALPVLHQAEDVRLFCLEYDEASQPYGFTPADEVAVALLRHGVKTTTQRQLSSSPAGEALLSYAKDHGSDLLVMGCYGHARFRELIFGGATRHILRHATIPLLMSH